MDFIAAHIDDMYWYLFMAMLLAIGSTFFALAVHEIRKWFKK